MKVRDIYLFACVATLLVFVTANPAHARRRIPVIFSWGGEKIIKVTDFPDTEKFQLQDGQYLDPGYRYKQVSLFFIPVWNYGGQWCGYIGSSSRYLNISRAELAILAKSAGIQLPNTPSLPFWDVYGGKILLCSGAALLFIAGKSRAKPSMQSGSATRSESPKFNRPTLPPLEPPKFNPQIPKLNLPTLPPELPTRGRMPTPLNPITPPIPPEESSKSFDEE